MISSYCGNLQDLESPVRAIQQGHGPGRSAVERAGVDEPRRPAPDIEGLVRVAGKLVIGTLRLEASMLLARVAVGHGHPAAVQVDQPPALKANSADRRD